MNDDQKRILQEGKDEIKMMCKKLFDKMMYHDIPTSMLSTALAKMMLCSWMIHNREQGLDKFLNVEVKRLESEIAKLFYTRDTITDAFGEDKEGDEH